MYPYTQTLAAEHRRQLMTEAEMYRLVRSSGRDEASPKGRLLVVRLKQGVFGRSAILVPSPLSGLDRPAVNRSSGGASGARVWWWGQ